MSVYAGLDLSLTGTGLVFIGEDGKVMQQELIQTSPPKKKSSKATIERIDGIRKAIMWHLIRQNVNLVAIEGFSYGSKGNALFQIAYLGYAIREELLNQGIEFIEPTPGNLKKFATAKGNAPKNVVMLEVYKKWGVEFTDDNLADAFILAQIAREVEQNNKLHKYQEEVIKTIKREVS